MKNIFKGLNVFATIAKLEKRIDELETELGRTQAEVEDIQSDVECKADQSDIRDLDDRFDHIEDDDTSLREGTTYWMDQRMGIPMVNVRYVHVFFNGTHQGIIYSDSQNPNKSFLKSWFPGIASEPSRSPRGP